MRDAPRPGGGGGGGEPLSTLRAFVFSRGAIIVIAVVLSTIYLGWYNNRDARPVVYMVANNPNANSTWATIHVRKWDLVVLFNFALPLPYFRHVPAHQMVCFLRQHNDTSIISEDRLSEFNQVFHKIVFVETKLARYISKARDLQPLLSLTHFEAIELQSQFIQSVYTTYARIPFEKGKRRLPSTGFLAYSYFQQYLPSHRIVLVGFTGNGHPLHNWAHEQHVYDTAGVQQL